MKPFEVLQQQTAADRDRLLNLTVLGDLSEGRFSLESYRAFLTNAYHHVRHTVPLMMACGSRLPDRLEWLRPALIEYIEEEAGHEQWILNDLAATGVDPNSIRESAPGLETELLVAYVYDFINRRNPVGFLGMVHVLEGTSTTLATAAADIVQKQLGLSDAAFSYLRSHGELDKEHVRFFEHLVNQLEQPQDLEDVVLVARRVYYLYGRVLDSVPREEARRVA